MRKILLIGLLLISSTSIYAQQIPNGEFDEYDTGWNGIGIQPKEWNGSNVSQKVSGFTATQQEVYSDENYPSGGGKSVKLVNTLAYATFLGQKIGSNAPAYITLGSPWVYATTNVSKCDGGTWGGISFSHKPDAIRGYIKREIATEPTVDISTAKLNSEEICNIIFYSWRGNTSTTLSKLSSSANQDQIQNNIVVNLDRAVLAGEEGVPVDNNETTKSEDFKLIAVGWYNVKPEEADLGWHEITIPITYKDDESVPQNMNIIISAADYFNRGNIGDNNKLWADGFEFVYNSELASLTYDGTKITSIHENMDLSEQKYDESKLSCELTGKGATVDKSYDETTGVLTLTVKGNDWTEEDPSNQHEYKIQFATPKPDEADGDYTPLLKISLAGSETFVPSVNDINIQYSEENGTVFTMKDFNFAGIMDLGDVVVPGATLSYVNGGIKVSVEDKKVTLPEVGEVGITVNAIVDDNKELTGTVDITYPLFPISVSLVKCPFERALTNYTLTVKGEVTSDVAAAVVPLGEKVGLVDLTQATLGAELNTSNFLYDPENTTSNTLYKIADTQSLKGNNVIKNGACDNFVLTDGQSFNAPEGFTANQITYKRATAASTDEKDEVYTFVLPFTFTADKVNGTVYKLTGVNDGVLDFTSVTGELEANHPYLVVSTGSELLNNEGLYGEVSATNDLTHEISGGVAMVGAYETTSVKSEGNESWYGYNANGQFVKANTGTINPFRTAIKSTGSQSSFALKLDGTVTGIVNLENPNAKVDVYTISGVCVRKNVPAASALNGLSRGVYIVGGQKVVK